MGRDASPPADQGVASLISKHIDGTKIGSMRLVAVRPSQVQAWVSDRSQVLSPGTLRLLMALFAVHLRSGRPKIGLSRSAP